jgi:Rieske 2Fe-2S family protein
MGPPPWHTLAGRDYHAPDVYALERERVFARSWVCVGRGETLPDAGDFQTTEVADEPLVVVRGRDGALRAFANVCRHRGTSLLEGSGNTGGGIRCPYHAWVYSPEGALIGTPNVHTDDGVDRERLGLWEVPLQEWGGFAFVNLDGRARPLAEAIADEPDSPDQLERYDVGSLRIGACREYDVAANWKIVVENYHECLHCPTVHPELVRIVPLYRSGEVEEEGQVLGNSMGEGLTSFTATGTSGLPSLPGLTGEDVHTFYGVYVFPNLILNYHSETVNVVTMHPLGPEHTRVVSEFLFDPSTIAAEAFDPSEVVEFRDLVARQDWAVCERAQRGVRSRFYEHGVYPRQEKWIAAMNRRYLEAMRDPVSRGSGKGKKAEGNTP